MTVLIFILYAGLGMTLLIAIGLVLFTAWTARRVEVLVPPLGGVLDVEGHKIQYLDVGTGPAIVMIHGLGSQMRSFTYALTERLTGTFRVILIDRPGCGYSLRLPGAPAELTAQADLVAAVIRTLDLDRPLITGHSLGGGIALALALNHPECVGGLALIAPLTHPQTEPPPALRGLAIPSPAWRWLLSWTIVTPLSILGSRATLEALFRPDPAPPDFGTKGGGLLTLRPHSFQSACSDLIAAPTDLPGMVRRYPGLRIPIGILYGTGDRILDPIKNGQAFVDAVPHATLDLLDAAGHMLPLSAPDATASFVTRMAQSVYGPST